MTTTSNYNMTYSSSLNARYTLFHSYVLGLGRFAGLPKIDPKGKRCNGND